MFNCIICTEKTQFTTKCHCQICLLCLLNWFEEKNKDKRIEIINCPNKDCLYTYSRDEILSYCSYQPYERIYQEILLKEYLKNQDIRPCPSGKCKFYGFIELSNKCNEELECLECGFKWRDFNQTHFTFKKKYIIKKLYEITQQFFYCLTRANECPNCGVFIQRIGGCKHMTCKLCNHQFCWYCKTQWDKHIETQCFLQYIILSGLLLNLLINILYQIGILKYVIYIFYPLLWIFEFFILHVLVIGTLVGIFLFFKSIYDLKSKNNSIKDNLLVFGGSILLLIIEGFILWFTNVFLQITFWKSFIGFLLELSIGIFILSYITKIDYKFVCLVIIGLFLFYTFGLNGLVLLIWKIPVIISVQYFHSQINFSAIALGVLILLNIFNLSELFQSKLVYFLMGSTYLHYRQELKDFNLALVGILAINYIYELIMTYI
ncbi:unnamed protein product [Paramecium pentaurelia]|uniref:RBR-type E3 ubiquitin transferase n=1 Tax=Paramecium pentaurelia TaxID=43138 RepID=A0A8S1VBU5_9CILI|nr:unnamed protein product [Paramecium pentaurelia]